MGAFYQVQTPLESRYMSVAVLRPAPALAVGWSCLSPVYRSAASPWWVPQEVSVPQQAGSKMGASSRRRTAQAVYREFPPLVAHRYWTPSWTASTERSPQRIVLRPIQSRY